MPYQKRRPEWSGPATDTQGIPIDLQGNVPIDVLPYDEPADWGRAMGREKQSEPEPAQVGSSMRALLALIQRGGGY